MKVLLISPPDGSLVYGKIGKRMPPSAPSLGLAYIAAVLEENDIAVKLLDARGEHLELEEIKNEIREYGPQVVGITCITPTFGISIEIAKAVKEISRDILLVMGGPHVSATAGEILEKYSVVDIAAVGEGEYTMLEIAEQKELDTIDGIVFRKDGEIRWTKKRRLIKELDSIPFPSRHFYDLDNYHQPLHEVYGEPLTTILSSRGCPFDCTFCSSQITFGRGTRFRSAENVLEEMDMLIEKYNIKGVKFADDTFSLNRERLETLCKGIKKRGIYWIGNARVDTLDKELLTLMKDSNCKMLLFGIETGDLDILKEYKKGTSLEQAREVMKWANQLKLDTAATFIFGAPLETKETIERTIEYAKELSPTYANFFILSPYPGTEIHERMEREGMMNLSDWTEVKSPKYENYIITHPNLTKEELKKAQNDAYKRFYLNLRHIWLLMTGINSLQKLKMYARLAKTFFSFVRK